MGVYLIKSSTINSIHCWFLKPQQWISWPATRMVGLLPPYNYWCDCYHKASPSLLSPTRGPPIFPHVIYTSSLRKLPQNFPFLQDWFFPATGLHLVWPPVTFISANPLFLLYSLHNVVALLPKYTSMRASDRVNEISMTQSCVISFA